MKTVKKNFVVILLTCVVTAQLAGCAKNPATGTSTFTGGLSEAREVRIGAENHPNVIKEFGG